MSFYCIYLKFLHYFYRYLVTVFLPIFFLDDGDESLKEAVEKYINWKVPEKCDIICDFELFTIFR